MENVAEIYGDRIKLVSNQYEALENADILAIITEWSIFRTPDFAKVTSMLKTNTIFDGRNLYDLDKMEELNMHYESIGRNPIKSSVPHLQNGVSKH